MFFLDLKEGREIIREREREMEMNGMNGMKQRDRKPNKRDRNGQKE